MENTEVKIEEVKEPVMLQISQDIIDLYPWAKLTLGGTMTQELFDAIKTTKICGRCKKPKQDCYCGRPQKYDEEKTIHECLEYLSDCEDGWERVITGGRTITETVADKETGEEKEETKVVEDFTLKRKVSVPSIEGLAYFLGISRDTVYDWKEKYPEFSYIIRKLQDKQTRVLIDKGLSGEYNSTISKVLLAKQGYKDESTLDLNNTGKPLTNLTPEQQSVLDKLTEKSHAQSGSVEESNNGK